MMYAQCLVKNMNSDSRTLHGRLCGVWLSRNRVASHPRKTRWGRL